MSSRTLIGTAWLLRCDVLATLMLGIVAGNKRYAHIAGARGDAVAAKVLRDRRDCESGFDGLEDQWGWGGFTTQDMHRSQVTARAVALVYNCWSRYLRAANPQARREALTSRPLLLAALGRATSSGNQTTLYLTPMHAEAGLI